MCAPCVWLCRLRVPCGAGCVGCVGPVRHPITKSSGRSSLPRPPHLHPTTKPASALQTFMTRLLPPIPDNQLTNTLPTLMTPSTMGGVRSKRSKCTQGNCKAWQSHDAHKALSAHVKCSTKATTQNTTHQRCVNAVQAKELRNPIIFHDPPPPTYSRRSTPNTLPTLMAPPPWAEFARSEQMHTRQLQGMAIA